jgi:quinol monooxygenase YgiN
MSFLGVGCGASFLPTTRTRARVPKRQEGPRLSSYDTYPVKQGFHRGPEAPIADEIELALVTGVFEARTGREAELAATLAKYVVLTRRRPECRNVDLVASVLQTGRLVIIEKWASPDAARAHLDAEETVEMAREATDLLSRAPDLDLLESVSAHDLE